MVLKSKQEKGSYSIIKNIDQLYAELLLINNLDLNWPKIVEDMF